MEQAHVLVCVTVQKSCERLIQCGAARAHEQNAQLSVLHVARPGVNILGNPEQGEALEYLYSISSEYGADMTMLRAEDVVSAIAGHAKKLQATLVVTGQSGRRGSRDIAGELALALPDTQIYTVYAQE